MIYVLIPVHNRIDYTRKCLECLRKQVFRDFETIVIDDGSTDGTSRMISEEFPEVTLLKGDGNLWWTKAINMGVNYVLSTNLNNTDSAILTLNDDLIIDIDYLSTLVKDYQENAPCLMGSVVVDINNFDYLEYAGANCNYYTAKGTRIANLFGNSYQQLKRQTSIISTDDLSGRGTLIPLELFNKIGLYDEQNFPHYMADLELSVRAKSNGYPLLLSVNSPVYCHLDATRNKKLGLVNFLKSFFVFTSPNYIKARFVYATRYSPIKFLYFFFDLGRLTFSHFLK